MVTRLAVDIGGTFTDVVLERDRGERLTSVKVLTTKDAPERAVLEGVAAVLERAGTATGDVEQLVHGTTLATNALIERKGAVTGLLTTAGFRDTVELAYENRFEQYDVFMERPAPLVPRHRRLGIPERVAATGEVLLPLDEDALLGAADELVAGGVTSVAVGFLHSYRNPVHEQRARELLRAAHPEMWVTLSSDVCPEIREYDRFSTACANAYVQPLVAGYLNALERDLAGAGIRCPLFLLSSSGGLCTFATGAAEPVRLVESGPAGGAMLAADLARAGGWPRVVSFDMGGTTAKLCLIEDGRPETARVFEVARMDRFLPGSGLPLRIPVVEMVEIGAGGGSIATVDGLRRVRVGPHSAAGDPGPACYGRGGTEPTVTDADVVLGRIDPAGFAGGELTLDAAAAAGVLAAQVAETLGTTAEEAAFGVAEVVDENMANAARVHAIERGFDVADHVLVAFGGAAPVHAARVAQKLGIGTVVVPAGAGVGSAIGFLRSPVAYEAVRTLHQRLDRIDLDAVTAALEAIRAEAHEVVAAAAPGRARREAFSADLRYVGQGHEVTVAVPPPPWGPAAVEAVRDSFESEYRRLFTRTIPHLALEALTWTVAVSVDSPSSPPLPPVPRRPAHPAQARRRVFDPGEACWVDATVVARDRLQPGEWLTGPAVITEAQTTTVVPRGARVEVGAGGELVLVLAGGTNDAANVDAGDRRFDVDSVRAGRGERP